MTFTIQFIFLTNIYIWKIENIELKAEFESASVRQKVEEDSIKKKNQNYNNANSSQERIKENSTFIKEQKQQTLTLLENQDKNIDILDEGATRLKELGHQIKDELEVQNKMLDQLEDDVDNANEHMTTVQAQLQKLLKSKDGCCQIWTIVILSLILVLLSFFFTFIFKDFFFRLFDV
jgi:predicted transcriptional regulator YheO